MGVLGISEALANSAHAQSEIITKESCYFGAFNLIMNNI